MHCVQQYECDAYGHVNHANYLRYMQEAAFDASAAASYDLDRCREIQRAWLMTRMTEAGVGIVACCCRTDVSYRTTTVVRQIPVPMIRV